LETTTDFILNHRVYLRQPLKGYRAGLDAVFLAASVPAQAGEEILDLGSGVGAAALAVLARVPGATGTGVEKVAEVAALARENAGLNHWADRLQVYADDLGAPTGPWADRVYDHVCANPPYYPAATFTQAAPGYKRAAHVETEGRL
jgi:tRNA1(Val) A37 N6-methylase TrmN6